MTLTRAAIQVFPASTLLQVARSSDLPVLDHEAIYPAELGRVVGNQNAAIRHYNGGNQHVISADDQPPTGQVRTNPTVLSGSGVIERQRGELLP
jgi:hypothetical protein